MVGRDTSDSDFNTILKTGGEKKHTLNIEEMPSHNHTQQSAQNNDGSTTYTTEPKYNSSGWWNKHEAGKTLNTGGSQAHNNLQPYVVVYRWRRIA